MAGLTDIPTPSGPFPVGCVDLMHKFEDETDSLLVRLFYPCDGNDGGRYQYAPWSPHERYIQGMMEVFHVAAPAMETFLKPKAKKFAGKLYKLL